MTRDTPRRPAVRWRRGATLVLLASAALAASCKRAAPAPPPMPIVQMVAAPPPPISPWPGTLSTALRAAESGRFAEAERILTDFGLANPGTPEGAESDFWRALLKTDPANRAVTPREASRSSRNAATSGASTSSRPSADGALCSRFLANCSNILKVSRYDAMVCGLAWR